VDRLAVQKIEDRNEFHVRDSRAAMGGARRTDSP
jgi:hypothetical protein